MAEFTEWDSFYVIIASAAGALIGFAVRRDDIDCRKAAERCREGQRRLRDADDCSF